MHLSSCLRRATLGAALLAQIGLAPLPAHAQSQPDWLVTINNIRTSAGLPAVPADPASTTGAVNHSRYVVQNNTLVHAEDPSKPGYTQAGDQAGQHGDVGANYANLGGGEPLAQNTIANFMVGAYHWEGILDTGLTSVGYGAATYQDVFSGQAPPNGRIGAAYTLVLNRNYAIPSSPILWPPSGGTMPYTSYSGGEAPDPLANCAGYTTPTGASLSLQLPAAPQVTGVTLTQAGSANTLPTCWFDSANVKFSQADQGWASTGTSILNEPNAVVIFPQHPLANGTYCVAVTNAGAPIQWSFTVGSTPTTPPAPCGSGASTMSAPLFRLFNAHTGDHLLTASTLERDSAVANDGYVSEIIAADVSTTAQTGLVPLYRLTRPDLGDRLYTTSTAERDAVASAGWASDGIAAYVSATGQTGLVPLYRLYNAGAGEHLFTIDTHERDVLSSQGWNVEGVAAYVAPAS